MCGAQSFSLIESGLVIMHPLLPPVVSGDSHWNNGGPGDPQLPASDIHGCDRPRRGSASAGVSETRAQRAVA